MISQQIAKISHNGSSVFMIVSEETKYVDIASEFGNRFGLVAGSFVLKYSIGLQSNCLLDNDRDVTAMLILKSALKDNFIDIYLGDKYVSMGSKYPMIDNVQESSCVDENEFFFNCRSSERKALLSENWRSYVSHVGQFFEGGVTEFRDKLLKYAAEMGFRFVYLKNEKTRIYVECFKKSIDGCEWFLKANLNRSNGFFYIKTLNNVHTCKGLIRTSKSSTMTSKLVSSVMINRIKDNPLMTAKEVVEDMKENYGFDVLYNKAWRGKEMANSSLFGGDEMSYNMLSTYGDHLLESNPGSHFIIKCVEGSNQFRRAFVALHACVVGFYYCPPVLSVDGTFLKSSHKGHLLGAIAKNGNQGIFPVAFAIVNGETEENWNWFMRLLYEILKDHNRVITFISDRNDGLCDAVARVFPSSPHGFCIYHLKQNIRVKYPGKGRKGFRDHVIRLFVNCAYAATVDLFNENLEKLIKEGGGTIVKFLETCPYKNWANAYFPGKRYGEMASNIAESFNSWIMKERFLPITQLIDGVRAKMMVMMCDRRLAAGEWSSVLCPEIEKKKKKLNDARNCHVRQSSDVIFEVTFDGYTHIVDLGHWVCSCRLWQIKGLPCCHACASAQAIGMEVFEIVENYFKTDFFKKSYELPINPVPYVSRLLSLGKDGIQPPTTHRQPGRPRVKRIKSSGEIRKLKCGRCGNANRHNKKTCTAII